jgi:hypothetical protein
MHSELKLQFWNCISKTILMIERLWLGSVPRCVAHQAHRSQHSNSLGIQKQLNLEHIALSIM